MLKRAGTLLSAFVLSSCSQEAPVTYEGSLKSQSYINHPAFSILKEEITSVMTSNPVGAHILVSMDMDSKDRGEVMVLAMKSAREVQQGTLNWEKVQIVCDKYTVLPVKQNENGQLSGFYNGVGSRYSNLRELVGIDIDNLKALQKEVDRAGVPLLLQYEQFENCNIAPKPMRS